MKCIYCGAQAGASEERCRNCGADLTLQRRIVRISNLLYNKGLDKAQVRDLSGAISCLKRSLKFNKDNTDARNLLGLCYFETGEVVRALVEWVISNNLRPSDNLASYYLQTIQSSKNRLDQYNNAIRKYNQSLIYCRQGNDDMARMQLRKVISQNPRFVRAYQLLALIYMHHEEWDKAKALLKKALRIDNTDTTTLRFLTEIEESSRRTSFFRKLAGRKNHVRLPGSADGWEDDTDEQPTRYVSGNEVIIAPSTFRDSSAVATFINIMLGLLLGAAIVWFLTVPAIRQAANDKANKQVTDANTSLATITATVQDLQDQVDAANADTDTAKAEAQSANDRVDSYKELLEAADLYVQGDQTKTVEALGDLNADDYDGEGKQLYDDLNAMVGDALFDQYYNAGTSAYVAGNYEEAATQLQQAVDSDTTGENDKYYDALYYLGFAYLNAGDTEKADEVFTQFSEKYPQSASIVAPYMSGGSGSSASGTSGSQGAASMDSSAQGTADSSGSGTSSDSTSGSSSVVWTDPTTGQGYDMYGNPVYSSSGTSSGSSSSSGTSSGGSSSSGTSSSGSSSGSSSIVWTDPATGQGYDMYGNPVYQ